MDEVETLLPWRRYVMVMQMEREDQDCMFGCLVDRLWEDDVVIYVVGWLRWRKRLQGVVGGVVVGGVGGRMTNILELGVSEIWIKLEIWLTMGHAIARVNE